MTRYTLDEIANAVLYKGHIVYPYRVRSDWTQAEQFTLGRMCPKDYTSAQPGFELCSNQTECLLHLRDATPRVEVVVRFLQPAWRRAGFLTGPAAESFQVVPELYANGTLYQTRLEAIERTITVSGIVESLNSSRVDSFFSFPASRTIMPLHDPSNRGRAAIERSHESIQGLIEIITTPVSSELLKIAVRVENRTPMDHSQHGDPEAVNMRTFASSHTVLRTTGGSFVSLLTPPREFVDAASQCKNIGTWPVLMGNKDQGESNMMLSSPLIVNDYPGIALENGSGSFDGIEIDETLPFQARIAVSPQHARQERYRLNRQCSIPSKAPSFLERESSLRV